MWAAHLLTLIILAVVFNAIFWVVVSADGLEPPAWFVIAFEMAFVVPLFGMLPSMRRRPGVSAKVAAAALTKWGKAGIGEFPTVDESRDRLRRAGWSVDREPAPQAGNRTSVIPQGVNDA